MALDKLTDIQPTINKKIFDNVTTVGPSVSTRTKYNKDLTVCIIANVDTTGGTIVCQGSPNGTDWGTVAATDVSGILNTDIPITESGTYFYEIVNASTLEYFRVNITSTDGLTSYTIYLSASSIRL